MDTQEGIYIRLLQMEDIEEALDLEIRNKDFFKHIQF